MEYILIIKYEHEMLGTHYHGPYKTEKSARDDALLRSTDYNSTYEVKPLQKRIRDC